MSQLNPEFFVPYNFEADVPKSRHNLSKKFSGTLQTGLLYPVWNRRMYIGDDFELDYSTLLQTIVPMNRALLDCFELRVETYFCPLSNYYGWYDNNTKSSTSDILNNSEKWSVALSGYYDDDGGYRWAGLLSEQQLQFQPDEQVPVEDAFQRYRQEVSVPIANAQPRAVQLGSLMTLNGIPAGFRSAGVSYDDEEYGYNLPGNLINIEPLLCYLDIWRTYHLNDQYGKVPYVSRVVRDSGTLSEYDFFDFNTWSPQMLDDFFVDLRHSSKRRSDVFHWTTSQLSSVNANYRAFRQWLKSTVHLYSGFFPVQHRPDIWRNLLSKTAGSVNIKVNVTNGSFVIDELRTKNKLQKLAEFFDLSGGRMANIGRTVFGVKSDIDLKIPELLNVKRCIIDPSNITQMAQTENGDLGEKAANVDKFNQLGSIRVKARTDGYVMTCVSITPLITYGQGMSPFALRTNFMDDFQPPLQRLGFQNVPQMFLSALPSVYSTSAGWSSVDLVNSVGKSIKWIEEMSDTNSVFGEFTPLFGDASDMVLSRIYSQLSIDDSNSVDFRFSNQPYVNPLDYNHIFADNAYRRPPWSFHMSIKCKARRPILKRWNPSLE